MKKISTVDDNQTEESSRRWQLRLKSQINLHPWFHLSLRWNPHRQRWSWTDAGSARAGTACVFVLRSRGTRTDEQQPTPPGALLCILEPFFNSEKKTSAFPSSETGRLYLTANNVKGGEREQSGQKWEESQEAQSSADLSPFRSSQILSDWPVRTKDPRIQDTSASRSLRGQQTAQRKLQISQSRGRVNRGILTVRQTANVSPGINTADMFNR